MREKTCRAMEKVTKGLERAGKEAVETSAETAYKWSGIMAEEITELGKRSLDVAKGTLSGMSKGAKEAIQKGKNNQ